MQDIIQKQADKLLEKYRDSIPRKAFEEMIENLKAELTPQHLTVEGSKHFYFTYGTDSRYPFRGGWSLVYAPDITAAIAIFRAYHPDRDDSGLINCASYYSGEYFESSESFKTGNFGGYCHETLGQWRPIHN